jgi:hypothetical protein
MLQLSYRQVRRLWGRYRRIGRKGLKQGNAGRVSNRSKAVKLRRRVLELIREKYSGLEEERFGPCRASLQCVFQRQQEPQKGNISNELTMGTLLTSFDNVTGARLTFSQPLD